MTSPAERRDWIQEVLERHERSLVLYAARITGDLERGRDVVQETFLRLLAEDRAALEGHLAEWLYTVCRNRALDVRAKERTMQRTIDAQALEPAGLDADPADALERTETLGRVRALMARLPENQREVLELKFAHGLSYKAISGVTRHPIGQVGWLIHRGLKSLRERMATDALLEAQEETA
jgi:RNA polymerase sigma-70 factor (ECF subfamily)